MRTLASTSALIFITAFVQLKADANAHLAQVFDQLNKTHTFSEVSISPDGRWIAWTEETPGQPLHATYLRQLHADENTQTRQIATAQTGSINGLAWSRDSKQLAFLGEVSTDQKQVFVLRPESADAPRQVTHLKGYIEAVSFSPDGTQLAFLYAENGGGGGPLQPLAPRLGEIGEVFHNQRLTTVQVGGGDLHQLSPEPLNVYEYDWAPDGDRFVLIAAPGPADDNWWIAKLFTMDTSGGEPKLWYTPPAQVQIAEPKWSPDGKRVAFIGGLMSDEGATGGDIYVAQEGGQPRDVTAGFKASATTLRWTGDDEITFGEAIDGQHVIATLRPSTKTVQQQGDVANLRRASWSKDGKTLAAVRSDFQHAPEVWAGPASNLEQITHVNADQKPQWGKSENITWTSGPFRVQGWLLYPLNFDPSKRYPLVVSVHGGPASMRGDEWPTTHFDMSVLSGLGYFVLFPNPRGSYGEGEAFTRANVKDFGHGDLKDVLAGVDAVVKRAPVDNNRIGVTGWSYGGYMTMWTVTQTQRFHAAVAGAGIANWLSYYGENDIDQWMVPYFGQSVYRDPAAYAKSSPIEYITQVKTPTLVLVGENDAECPAPQSFEFWHALRTLGVPTKLVVYAGEGHAFHEDKDQLSRMQQTAAWFAEYLK